MGALLESIYLTVLFASSSTIQPLLERLQETLVALTNARLVFIEEQASMPFGLIFRFN